MNIFEWGATELKMQTVGPGRRDKAHPDPAGMAAVDPTNPQSWNRYAYVLNNPLPLVDPLGLCVVEGVEYSSNDWICGDTGGGKGGGGGGGGNGSSGQVPVYGYYWNDGWHPYIVGFVNIPSSGGQPTGNPIGGGGGGGGAGAANNGNCQAPFICNPTNTPVVQKTPTPPDTHTGKYSDYVACAFGTEINDMFGDKNKAATTVLINIAPLAPANYLKGGPIPYLIVAVVWDIGHALKARSECTASVYGR